MKRAIIKRCFQLGTLIIGLLSSVVTAYSEERELKNGPIDNIDAVLVLDASGSMRVTDPHKLRDEGAKLFAQFLKAGDRLSIIGFDQTARVIRPLSEYNANQSDQISKDVEAVGNSGLYTNILEAIKLARATLEASPRQNSNPVIILLSDGKMEPDPAQGSAELLTKELVDVQLAALKTSGVKVYTLYFSDEADQQLLKEVAATTDAINWFTPTADKIHESFANLFLAVKKPQVVPLTKKGFHIDNDVQEATFYINHEGSEGEVALTGPGGHEIKLPVSDPTIKWFKGQKFDVVTLNQPTPGDWQISGVTTNDGFATVLTNIKLVADWPDQISSEETALLQARLYEDKKPISLPEIAKVTRYAVQVTPTDKVSEPVLSLPLQDDGKNGDKIAGDGIFTAAIRIDEPGMYVLRVVSKSPTFERTQIRPFQVKPAIISLSIQSAKAAAPTPQKKEEGKEGGEESHAASEDTIVATLDAEASTYTGATVKLFAIDEQRSKYEIPLTQSSESKLIYEAKTDLLPHHGEFELNATFSAQSRKGKSLQAASKKVKYNKVKGDENAKTVQIVTKEEKPKEENPSPVLWIILVTIVNLGAGGAVFTLLKKLRTGMSEDMPTFESLDVIISSLAELKAHYALVDVDLAHPMFVDESFKVVEPYVHTGGAPTSSEAAPAPAPEAPETPGGEE